MENYFELTNPAIALLTFALVIITAYYAKVTASMLREMRDTRLAELRPFISYKFQEIVYVDDDKTRHWKPVVILTNYSSYDAINLEASLSIQRSNKKEDKIVNPIKSKNSILNKDENIALEFHLPTTTFTIPDRIKDFGELEVWFEDRKQNLYILSINLDLFRQPHNLVFIPRTESLYQIPLEERSSLHDQSSMVKRTHGRAPLCKRVLYN